MLIPYNANAFSSFGIKTVWLLILVFNTSSSEMIRIYQRSVISATKSWKLNEELHMLNYFGNAKYNR